MTYCKKYFEYINLNGDIKTTLNLFLFKLMNNNKNVDIDDLTEKSFLTSQDYIIKKYSHIEQKTYFIPITEEYWDKF